MEASPRFFVQEGSASGHCCFEYSVIDTAVGTDVQEGKHVVCECYDKNAAIAIAFAMNQCDTN